MVDWYERKLGTEFETAPLPVLYLECVGQFMNLMPETGP